ncbi:MAG: NADH-quinone oxidoreductase subunit H [Gemmatimonadales bacterium]
MSGGLHLVWEAVLATTVLGLGAYVTAVLDGVIGRLVAREAVSVRRAMATPLRQAALLLLQQRTATERPDAAAWLIAPTLLGGIAAVSVALVPVGPSTVVADADAGIVLFGAVAALVMVAVYLHGWAPNSVFPLVGGYRFVALALSYEMPLALVLIGAALPAQSLNFSAIVASQADVWNVIRQPLGLPIYIIACLGLAFRGPLGYPDAADLAGGTLAETSGGARLAWQAARAALLAAVAAIGATAFLGGWLGPWLPGAVWVAVKTLALLALLVAADHLLARVRLERFVVIAWTVLIPLALVDVFLSGVLAL